jgi:murein DD-endopeptidase MepM/ murein hydrolase activator NlpD
VRAVASGAVSEAGWENELGRCVRVGHAGSITSLYGHLSRFAAGIREGVQVERGQIIGYVGTTGSRPGRTSTSRWIGTASTSIRSR